MDAHTQFLTRTMTAEDFRHFGHVARTIARHNRAEHRIHNQTCGYYKPQLEVAPYVPGAEYPSNHERQLRLKRAREFYRGALIKHARWVARGSRILSATGITEGSPQYVAGYRARLVDALTAAGWAGANTLRALRDAETAIAGARV